MYHAVPDFAWSGWRLRIPGGPAGGQYHGFIGPDSTGWVGPGNHPPAAAQPSPWQSDWGGTALGEGESMSDYVRRGPAEMRPRANASGGTNVVSAFQTQKSAGYAEAPGNYKALGVLPIAPVGSFNFVATPEECAGPQCPGATSVGATNVITQPPPPTGPGSGYLTTYSVPPVSPAPAPTVSSVPTAAVTTDPISAWLTSSTIVTGVENLWIAAAAAAAAYFMLRVGK